MTDETPRAAAPPPEPPPTTSQPSGMAADVSSMMARLGPGEKLIVIGAAILLVDFVIIELIAGEYSFWSTSWLAAIGVVVFAYVRHNRSGAIWSVPYATLLRVLGFAIAIIALTDLIEDLRYERLGDAFEWIGGLAHYVAGAMAGWGALQLKSQN